MPKEIISLRKREDNLYFVITGSRDNKNYLIDIVKPGKLPERLYSVITGIQDSRSWIARYVKNHYESLPIYYEKDQTLITDCCVKPGRD
jgi:hypothetical protein